MKQITIPGLLITLLFSSLLSFTPARNESLVDDVLNYTNKFRKSKGLPALVMRDDLNTIAQKHTENMAAGKVSFGHDGFEKRQTQMKSAVAEASQFAENVAYGASSGEAVVNEWKKSNGHRRNMLGDYKYIGIGVARNNRGILYYTQVFVN